MCEENYIILDCDTGVDDAWALLILLKAEKLKKCKILGITCVTGNTNCNNSAINTLRILNIVNRTDIPVFKGCNSTIVAQRTTIDYKHFFGNDGFCDLVFNEAVNKDLIQKTHAINAMYEYVCKYPNKITFILIGPLTNFAVCSIMYEDFLEKVKEIYIMGGNMKGVGNSSSNAEFNFYFDPEAAHIVLKKATCPITILPWEACLENINITMDWRLGILAGKDSNEILKLLNDAEIKAYSGEAKWLPCDSFLAALMLFPEEMIVSKSLWHATIELCGQHTRGQMVLDHLKNGENIENVQIIEEISDERFKQIALWTVSDENSLFE